MTGAEKDIVERIADPRDRDAVSDAQEEITTLRAKVERLTKERDIAIGERVSRAKAMLHVRDQLSIIDTNIEDETDRVYFRSTNDADAFKDVVQELEDWAWHDILRDTQKVDPFETSRLAIKRAEAAEAALAKVREKIFSEFPLVDDDGLDEVEHHCEWAIQRERKRLHASLTD